MKVICGITADTIMLQPFPEYNAAQVDEAALADTEWLKQAIVAVRNIRAEMNIARANRWNCCCAAVVKKPFVVLTTTVASCKPRRVWKASPCCQPMTKVRFP